MPIRNLVEVFISPNRIRKEFPPAALEELIRSILDKGLLHPPVVEDNGALLVGERRFRALSEIAARGETYHCNGKFIRPGLIFTTDIRELSSVQRLEAELEENTIRLDLTWQEKAQAVEALHQLRTIQKAEISPAIPGLPPPEQTPRETAAEIRAKPVAEVTRHEERDVRADLMVAGWLAAGEDDEVSRAATRSDALKIIERRLEDAHRAELARRFRDTQQEGKHTLRQGDLLTFMKEMPDGIFDAIITDPPWGVGADTWNNGNALREHTYLDDVRTFNHVHTAIAIEGFRLCKPKAHLYLMCAFQNFERIAVMFRGAGWDVWPRPFIWYKGPNSGIAPRPEHGPMNTYECILYALKGDKRMNFLAPDIILVPKTGLDLRAAQKPPGLYYELLRRSVVPGDEVFDPCCGTGPIFPAANALKIRATGFDIDDQAIGIASGRLEERYEPRELMVADRPATSKVKRA